MSTTDTAEKFIAELGFEPDDFQREAMSSIDARRSVLVAAPTGAGKTLVGEYACYRALVTGGRAFYTTPIKALSNQKYRDFCEAYGEESVGLLTGDRTINGDASIVVMTTEVLRNMVYERSSSLRQLTDVVMDEVHYLADTERGVVWEEILIQLAQSIPVTSLSATVSNAEEFAAWLRSVRGDCDVVITEHRPVPLRHWYFVNDKLYPTLAKDTKHAKGEQEGSGKRQGRAKPTPSEKASRKANPELLMLERKSATTKVTKRGRRVHTGGRLRWPDRRTVVEELARREWLPAIFFVFSRNGCTDAVQQLLHGGVRLTTADEADEIDRIIERTTAELSEDTLRTLGFETWRDGMRAGLAPHHAGLVPAFKEAAEVAFQSGLLRVVVATETLALGINMPASTVVIERLTKYNGTSNELLTPGQFTQLTGRAGRRGMDTVGHAVVLHQRSIPIRETAGLVSSRSHPIISAFTPSNNMVVNLLTHATPEEAEALLEKSLAQFQTERRAEHLANKIEDLRDAVEGYTERVRTEIAAAGVDGDWQSYWELRREREQIAGGQVSAQQRRQIRSALRAMQPGDVLHLPWAGRRGRVAMIGMRTGRKGGERFEGVDDEGSRVRMHPADLAAIPRVIGAVTLPGGSITETGFRRNVAQLLREVEIPPSDDPASEDTPGGGRTVDEIDTELAVHAWHDSSTRESVEEWQVRVDVAQEDLAQAQQGFERSTQALARLFRRRVAMLRDAGWLVDDGGRIAPSEDAEYLAGIHSSKDLLVAEALRAGTFEGLKPSELVAVVAYIVYEPGRFPLEPERMPSARVERAIGQLSAMADRVRAAERAHNLPEMPEMDAAMVRALWRWADGADLSDALGRMDLAGGDFVRICRQAADLCSQLREAAPPGVGAVAAKAVRATRRSVAAS